MRNQPSTINHQTSRHGFTLIEVLVATLLIGLAIAALVGANGSFSMTNVSGADLSTAEFLTEQIRELTMLLPLVDSAATNWSTLQDTAGETTLASYTDVAHFRAFDSSPLGAPINAQRTTLPDLAAFRQQVSVQKVTPSNFDQTQGDSYVSNFARVTVTILKNGQTISSATWVRAKY
jgi:prepilin-type N-terminal cleavage/methylation domain-containing protein